MVPLDRALSPNAEAVVAEVIDGEAVLIDLATGIYYSMDKVGGSIWSLIETGSSVEEIVAAIAARYEVSREQAQSDVRRVVTQLVEEKLVVVSEESPGRVDQEISPQQMLPYATPELKTYRDMGDLLALDPPLPGMREIPWQATGQQPLD
jgi:Coenzyme PQQ synthesis protein D (PqqD)